MCEVKYIFLKPLIMKDTCLGNACLNENGSCSALFHSRCFSWIREASLTLDDILPKVTWLLLFKQLLCPSRNSINNVWCCCCSLRFGQSDSLGCHGDFLQCTWTRYKFWSSFLLSGLIAASWWALPSFFFYLTGSRLQRCYSGLGFRVNSL